MKQPRFILSIVLSLIMSIAYANSTDKRASDDYSTYLFEGMSRNIYGGVVDKQSLTSKISGWDEPVKDIMWWHSAQVGSKVDFYLTVDYAGMYNSSLAYIEAHDYSIYDVYVNNVYYTTIDGYNSKIQSKEVRIGSPIYKKGTNIISFVLTGKNAKATAPYSHMVGFHSLKITTEASLNDGSQFVADSIYIVGDFDNWDISKSRKMDRVGDHTFGRVMYLAPGKFKFHTQAGSWNPSINATKATTITPDFSINNNKVEYKLLWNNTSANDHLFTLTKGVFCTVYVNYKEMSMSIEFMTRMTPMFLVGDATEYGWNYKRGVDMYRSPFTQQYEQSVNFKKGQFKILKDLGSWDAFGPAINGNENVVYNYEHKIADNGFKDYKFVMHDEGRFRILVDTTKMTMKVVPGNSELDRLYMVGDATPNKWDRSQSTKMTRDSAGVFTWVGILNKGHMKFLTTIDTPANEWISIVPTVRENEKMKVDAPDSPNYISNHYQGDYRFNITESGFYSITVNMGLKTVVLKTAPQRRVVPIDDSMINEMGKTFNVVPMSGYAQVTPYTDKAVQRAELINMNGQVVDAVQNAKGEFVLGNNMPKGVYIIHIIYGNNQTYQQKVNIR